MNNSPNPSNPTPSIYSNSPSSTRVASLACSASKLGVQDDMTEQAFPVAVLDTNTISPLLSARLCLRVLEHTLYLNGQIPFPVHSLSRLRLDSKSHAKAARKRADLLSALDILSTHLPSSFQSLSWAMAMNKSLRKARHTTLHLMVITGPSPTAAKARCFIALDGFCVQAFGHANQNQKDDDDIIPEVSQSPQPDQENLLSPDLTRQETKEQDEKDELDSHVGDVSFSASSTYESSDEDQDSHIDPGETSFMSSISEAMSHISLGSCSTTSSRTLSDSEEDCEDSFELSEEEEVEEEDEELELPSGSQSAPVMDADDEKFIESSVRALSLAMASSCDFSRDDLAPTQVHVLLRAPRRFSHPSWLPKQNLQKTLDDRLFSFFEQMGGKTKVFEEGIKVVCNPDMKKGERLNLEESCQEESEGDTAEDDMIWWQWNAAPFRGFSDM